MHSELVLKTQPGSLHRGKIFSKVTTYFLLVRYLEMVFSREKR